MMRSFLLICSFIGLLVSTLVAQYDQYDYLGRYIENPSMVEENQEPPHVPYVPFESVQQAVEGDWEISPFHMSLNGTWKFSWSKNPLIAPEYFYLNEYDASDWGEIQVPGTWQMRGDDCYVD